MKPRSGATRFGILPPASDPVSREIPARRRETSRIVKRLLAIVAAHAEAAARMKAPLGLADFLAVIDALAAESDGLDPAVHLVIADDVRACLRRGLFDELLGEPSNIFLTTTLSAETIRYEAMPKEFWLYCLALLRSRLLPPSSTHS